jgi:hydrogenase small subunit
MTPASVPEGQEEDASPVHVLWLTTGLGCDGDSVALTAATNPSLEDILGGIIPGAPPVVLHNQLLAYENGDAYMQA